MAQGILSPPQLPDQTDYAGQLKGILGNLGGQSGWQALTALGAGLARLLAACLLSKVTQDFVKRSVAWANAGPSRKE